MAARSPIFRPYAVPSFGRIAEVEPNEDARIGVLVRRLGEAGVRADYRRRIVTGAPGRERRAAILKADLVGAEELLQHLSPRSAFDGVTRRIVLVRRCRTQWCPGWITAALDRGDRAPEVVMVLGRDHGDVAIRQRHVEQGEQPRVLPLVQSLVGRDGSRDAAPFQRRVFEPEQRDLGLVVGAGAGRRLAITAQRFHFVQVSGEASSVMA